MSFYTPTIHLKCDTCGKIYGTGESTKLKARVAARNDGWKRVKHYRKIKSILGTKLNLRAKYYLDHCPACLLTPAGQTEDTTTNEWVRVVR